MVESAEKGRSQLNGSLPPAFEGWEVLVYGECRCGWRCAMPEGARWPECPCCGVQVLPIRGVYGGEGAHGEGVAPGYVAQLLPDESDAVVRVRERGGSQAGWHRATNQNFRYFRAGDFDRAAPDDGLGP